MALTEGQSHHDGPEGHSKHEVDNIVGQLHLPQRYCAGYQQDRGPRGQGQQRLQFRIAGSHHACQPGYPVRLIEFSALSGILHLLVRKDGNFNASVFLATCCRLV
jgi:hypothetical protein